jgi:hypothetical protein
MEANYTIDGLVWSSSKFFYLYNWRFQNTISLFGTADKSESFRNSNYCVGVWKIKNK